MEDYYSSFSVEYLDFIEIHHIAVETFRAHRELEGKQQDNWKWLEHNVLKLRMAVQELMPIHQYGNHMSLGFILRGRISIVKLITVHPVVGKRFH